MASEYRTVTLRLHVDDPLRDLLESVCYLTKRKAGPFSRDAVEAALEPYKDDPRVISLVAARRAHRRRVEEGKVVPITSPRGRAR